MTSVNETHAHNLRTAVYILILVVPKTGFKVPILEGGMALSCHTRDEIILFRVGVS